MKNLQEEQTAIIRPPELAHHTGNYQKIYRIESPAKEVRTNSCIAAYFQKWLQKKASRHG
jgi:hypothetical protein